jgi:CHASE2 domain-containing sensor protein
MATDTEIRSYLSPYNADITFGIFVVGALLIQLIAASNGRFIPTLPAFLLIYLSIAFIWHAQRRATFIAINLDKKTLDAVATFFLPRKRIPVAIS